METTLLNDKQLSEIEGRIAVAKELLSKENTITLTKNEKEVLVAFGEILDLILVLKNQILSERMKWQKKGLQLFN